MVARRVSVADGPHLFQFYISTIMVPLALCALVPNRISILHKYDYGRQRRAGLRALSVISILHKYDYGDAEGVLCPCARVAFQFYISTIMVAISYASGSHLYDISILHKYDYGGRRRIHPSTAW